MTARLEHFSERSLPVAGRRVAGVLGCLAELRSEGVWPAGARCLWTDAHGLVLLVSLHRIVGETWLLDQACDLAEAVQDAIGGELGGYRGPADELGDLRPRDFGMWIFALGRLGRLEPAFRDQGLRLARAAHELFVLSERVHASPEPDVFVGYAAFRSLDEPELAREIADLGERIERRYRDLVLTRDQGLGTMLWLSHLHPQEPWAELQRARCLRILEHLWVDPPGCFCREPGRTRETSATANHAISIGLQAAGAMPDRVESLRRCVPELADGRQGAPRVLACCAELPGDLLRAHWHP